MSVLTIANLLHSSPVAWDHLTKTTPTHSRIHHQHSPAQSRLLHGDYTGYHGTNKTEPSCPDPRSGLKGERGKVRATTGLSDHPHYPPKRCEERWSLVRLTTVRCLASSARCDAALSRSTRHTGRCARCSKYMWRLPNGPNQWASDRTDRSMSNKLSAHANWHYLVLPDDESRNLNLSMLHI